MSSSPLAVAYARLLANPDSPPAKQGWLDALPLTVRAAVTEPVPPAQRRALSVVICSIDDARYAAAAASYGRALADWPHEIVRIGDARSLADGYTRGLARTQGEVVAFSHDDVAILPADFGHRLAQALAAADIVGVAGASRVAGPAWPHAGHPYLHGCVVYPDGDGYRVSVYSRQVPIATGIRVLDGVLLAMPRDVAAAVGWDETTCPGFHGYDVDFSVRATQHDAVMQPEARQLWRRIVNQGWTDALRALHPTEEKLYTFWDYTAGCWQRDAGFRIDHLLCSPEAADRLQAAGVDKWARAQDKASDHAPTWIELS